MPPTSEVPESVWAEHESVIRRFEEAWADGRPDLPAFLASGVRDPGTLLVELIQIDLEFRFRAGEQPRVEEYVRGFPDLNSPPVLAELVGSELALRDRHGQAYSEDEVRERFPQLADRLDTLMVSGANRTRTPNGGAGRWTGTKPDLPGYVVGEQLGRGGMGVVYRAEQASPARTVAVKTLLSVPTERTAARFRREAEAMARLDHPNIVPVYEVGEWGDGGVRLPYLTMKWYPGGSLDSSASGPGTPVADHARVVETVARAVHHAHQRGVLHRDLKPSNILLDADGQPAVADFGLAGWFDPADPEPMSTTVVGTPAFMAPEQARDPSGVTTATDVYGLGAILYHRLTGRPPVQASTALAAFEQLGSVAPDKPSAVNPAVPRDLETVCLKCLEADPRNRYPSAEAVADDLARWRKGESITARRPGMAERLWRTVRRHPVMSALSAATVAAVVVTIVTLAVSVQRVREKEAETAGTLEREKKALYLERVAAVGRLYQSNHTEQAWHTLDLCPSELRDWEWGYLDRLRKAGATTELTQCDKVSDATFLADGRVVTAEVRGDVRVWQKGESVRLAVNGTAVKSHPIDPVLAVRDGKTITVLDVEQGTTRCQVPGEGWFTFTPDGRQLLVADKGRVRVFDSTTGKPTGDELNGHDLAVSSGVFSPDGGTLYTGSHDKSVVVWDWKAKREKARWKRESPVYRLALTADGETLFETHNAKLFATNTGTGTTRQITDVVGSRPVLLPTDDPGQFVTTNVVGEVVVRRMDSAAPTRVYRGHVWVIRGINVSTDGRKAVTIGDDGTARVWDLTDTPDHSELSAPPYKFAAPVLSPDGRTLAVVSRNVHETVEPQVIVSDARSGKERYRVKGAGDAAFDPKGRWLAVGRADGSIRLHDPADGTEMRALTDAGRATVGIQFSPDGSKLAAVGVRGPVRVWDTGTWAVTGYTQTHGSLICLAWSPDGSRLAIADGDVVVIWDPGTGDVGKLVRPTTSPLVCAFSPDGKSLAVAGRGRSLELFDPATGRPLVEFIGNPSPVNGLAFHPSGRRLASVGVNGEARLWDTTSGKEVLALSGGGDLFGVAWSPDGKDLYAAGAVVRRWTGGQ